MMFKGILFAVLSASAIANGRAAELPTAAGVYSQPAPDTTDKEPHYSQPVRNNLNYFNSLFLQIPD